MKDFDDFVAYLDVNKMQQIKDSATEYAELYLTHGHADPTDPLYIHIQERMYNEGVIMGMLREYHQWLND